MNTDKIDKLIEEAFLLAGPALVPGIQNNYANNLVDNIKSKKELDAFKKDYSGGSDYKKYDEYPAMAKRGATYGLATALPFGIIASQMDGDLSDNMEVMAGLTGATTLGGAILPGVSRGVAKLLEVPSLKSRVGALDKKYKEKQ